MFVLQLLYSDVADLRAQISLANNIGENEHADWLGKVLDLNNNTVAVDNQGPYSPQQYLDKGTSLCRVIIFLKVKVKVIPGLLGPTQPLVQWVQGALSLGVKRSGREADHSPPSSVEVKE
jgi:hypothetical protein